MKFSYVSIAVGIISISAKLGANAVLGVSLAVCKAGAAQKVRLFCVKFSSVALLSTSSMCFIQNIYALD